MKKSKAWVHGVLVIIGALVIVWIFYYLFTAKEISPNHSLLANLMSVITTSLISLYLARQFSYVSALERIEGEAKKALRRIYHIKLSVLSELSNCERIVGNVERDHKEDSRQKLLLEYFGNVQRQLVNILQNVDLSIDDWEDLLPEQVKGIRRSEQQQSELVQEARKEVKKLRDEYAEKLEKTRKDDKKQLRREFDAEMQRLRSEFEGKITDIRYKTAPFTSAPIMVSGELSYPNILSEMGSHHGHSSGFLYEPRSSVLGPVEYNKFKAETVGEDDNFEGEIFRGEEEK